MHLAIAADTPTANSSYGVSVDRTGTSRSSRTIDVERPRNGSPLLLDQRLAGTAKTMGEPIAPAPTPRFDPTSGFGVLITLPIIKALDGDGPCTIGEHIIRMRQRRTSKRDRRRLLTALANEGLVSVSGDGPSARWDVTPFGRDWAHAAEQRAASRSMAALHCPPPSHPSTDSAESAPERASKYHALDRSTNPLWVVQAPQATMTRGSHDILKDGIVLHQPATAAKRSRHNTVTREPRRHPRNDAW